MKRIRLRPLLLNVVLIILVGTAWIFLAPSRVGGFTTYVVTHGVSMEPRFHGGDLALIRPAGQYRVGDIVGYHSSVVHQIVLHRIVAIHAGHYTFKGDNNNFLDPVHPTRSQLVGKLWLHLPRAGKVLGWLHDPIVVSVIFALLGLSVFWGFGEKQQRRRRRRQATSGSASHGPSLVSTPESPRVINFGAYLAAAAVAAVTFFALGVFTFAKPTHHATQRSTQYTQQVTFGYSAHVPAGPVYPSGTIKTNDPVFLSIVHRLDVHIGYRFDGAASSGVAGTEKVLLTLTGPGAWSRNFVLAPATRFTRGQTDTDVPLDLSRIQSLIAQVTRLTGNNGFSNLIVTVRPVVHVSGTVGGHPVRASYQPGLSFQFESGQLLPSASPSSAGAGSSGAQGPNYRPSQAGTISTPTTAPSTITVLGVSPTISSLRSISIVGLLLSAAAMLFFFLRKRGEPFEESVRIQAQYGHMIVPIVGGEDLGWPPVDVPNIKALVMLAESGQRLILHNRSNGVDTYMVNDEGTVYRYQVKPSKVVWGEWSDGDTTPLQAAA